MDIFSSIGWNVTWGVGGFSRFSIYQTPKLVTNSFVRRLGPKLQGIMLGIHLLLRDHQSAHGYKVKREASQLISKVTVHNPLICRCITNPKELICQITKCNVKTNKATTQIQTRSHPNDSAFNSIIVIVARSKKLTRCTTFIRLFLSQLLLATWHQF